MACKNSVRVLNNTRILYACHIYVNKDIPKQTREKKEEDDIDITFLQADLVFANLGRSLQLTMIA